MYFSVLTVGQYLGIVLVAFMPSNNSHGCPCGKRFTGNNGNDVKIVGGQLSKQNAWPWTVALVHVGNGRPESFCGASLINNMYALTAGHCVYEIVTRNRSLADYKVFMGDIRLNGSSIVRYDIASVKVHPFFDPETLQNDIAIVRLSTTVSFSNRIRPICLHQPTGQQLSGQMGAIVVGWGSVRTDGPTVNSQRQVVLRLVPTNTCRNSYRKVRIEVEPTSMLCASSDRKDSCAGDSGGPLFLKRKSGDVFEQIGIVSFGRNCAQKAFPGVYTKISTFGNFIQSNTKDAEKC